MKLCACRLVKGSPATVKASAHMVRRLTYDNKDRLCAGMICAGWDVVDGGSVYAVSLGGACVQMPFAIGGSGSTYIYGLVDSLYHDDMDRSEAVDFVKTGSAIQLVNVICASG